MSKQPLGKTLLRNVIRQTGAHNKIQEETEMWKMRSWEVQMSQCKQSSNTESVRGRLHCDRVPDQGRDLSQSRVSEHDDRETRYWTRKLYEFEANDPDRWGHSGFKELYPEEFQNDGERNSGRKKIARHKTSKSDKSKSDTEASLSKRSKKCSRKKKKKKKDEDRRRKKADCSSSGDDSSTTKDKQRRKRTKSRHKNKKNAKARRREEDSSPGDSNDDEDRERRTRSRKRRKQDSPRDSDSGPNLKKKRRKNWKAADEESSHDSSGD
uniref:NKAP domain containing 1 n=1 Tax=Scatophagus argus TaxID=75038 RepID=UPI001ED7F396|nr:NKAP domain containing 1 [Scatophagus argus]XP_046245382.1 NKAP domain containing 1 [Scatophagus argus]XP_046245384.1 NKAP domain containing 1 [Scatophagus argus]